MKKKKLITRDEANTENWKRSDKEHDEVFPSMFNGLKSLKLKRIDIITGNRNNHQNKHIKKDVFYLVGYSGNWFISKGRLRDKDWMFDLKYYDVGIGMLDFLFEIVGLPEYKSDPLGRVQSDFDDYGDRIYDNE